MVDLLPHLVAAVEGAVRHLAGVQQVLALIEQAGDVLLRAVGRVEPGSEVAHHCRRAVA